MNTRRSIRSVRAPVAAAVAAGAWAVALGPDPAAAQEAAAWEAAAPYAATDRYERRAGVDVLHYAIELELPAEGRRIEGRTSVLFEATGEDPVQELTLDFAAGMAVDSAAVDGARVAVSRSGDALRLELPETDPGARREAVVWYRGAPSDGLIFGETAAGARTVFADNWPDRGHAWFPSVDHPSDKATAEFEVVAPSGWEVVANGTRTERTELGDGRTRTRWAESAEIPTYTMVLGATDFAVQGLGEVAGVELSAWSYPADSAAAAAMFSRTAEIVALYDSLFGPFPYEKLAQVQSATRYGGMENASAIFYSARSVAGALRDSVSRSGSASVVPHEIVHQWFGDAVTEADWNHLWLSEGFATYFAAVFFELRGSPAGSGPEELARRMRAMREEVLDHQQEHPKAAVVAPGLGPGEYEGLLTDLKYEKGAWVLHMLRDLVGEEAFFSGIRDYYATFRDGTAWTEDFERIMEEAAGRELDWFFDQWLHRPGHPVLALERGASGGSGAGEEGEGEGEAAAVRTVTLRQLQEAEPFRFPVELRLEWEGGARTERVWMEGREGSWTFEAPAPLEEVTVDPNVRLLWVPEG